MFLWLILPAITLSIVSSIIGWLLIRQGRIAFGVLSGLAVIAAAPLLFTLWERWNIAQRMQTCLQTATTPEACQSFLHGSESATFTFLYLVAGVLCAAVIFLLASAAISDYYDHLFEWLQTFLYLLGAVAIIASVVNLTVLNSRVDEYAIGENPVRVSDSFVGIALGLSAIILATVRGRKRRITMKGKFPER